MAVITSQTTGAHNWSDAAAWVGGALPTPEVDSVVIASGCTITLSDTRSIGDGTTAVNAIGTLVITGTGRLNANGSVTIANSPAGGRIEQQAGSIIDMSAGVFDIIMATISTNACSWQAIGVSNNRVQIIGGGGRIRGATSAATTIDMQYVTISGFTGATGNQFVGATSLNIDHTLFIGNAGWIIGTLTKPAASVFNFTNNDARSIAPSVSSNLFYFQKTDATSTNTTISGNTFVGDGINYTTQNIAFRNIQGVPLNDNVFYNVKVQGISAFHGNTWDGTIVWADSQLAAWAAKQSIYIGQGDTVFKNGVLAATTNNWHGIDSGNTLAVDIPSYIQDSVIHADWTSPQSTANAVFCSNANSVNIERNIFTGATGGILPASAVGATKNVNIKSNTFANFNPGGGVTTQKFQPVLTEFAGRISGDVVFTSNMVYNNGDNTDNQGFNAGDAAYPNLTASGNNAFYNILDANKYLSCQGTPGVNDISGSINPQFVDPARTIASYAVANGKAAMVDFFTESVKRNGYDLAGNPAAYNSSFAATPVLEYIKAGFTPTNAALATAGEGGTYIGAVMPYIAPTTRRQPNTFRFSSGFRF